MVERDDSLESRRRAVCGDDTIPSPLPAFQGPVTAGNESRESTTAHESCYSDGTTQESGVNAGARRHPVAASDLNLRYRVAGPCVSE